MYVLHTSVPIRWWLIHLPDSAEAERFRTDKVASGQVGIVAVEGIELEVLSELAKDLGQEELDPSIATELFYDVSKVFREMAEFGVLRSVNRSLLAFPAFVIAALYNISFCDALAVALAAQRECPLLVADDELYQKTRIIQADRPAFRVVRLSEV